MISVKLFQALEMGFSVFDFSQMYVRSPMSWQSPHSYRAVPLGKYAHSAQAVCCW